MKLKNNLFKTAFILVSVFTVIFGFSSGSYAQNIDQIPLRTLDGDTIYLSQIKDKKILIVNTASKCGYTKQYADLQQLYDKYKDQLVIIGFPTDNFMNQEFKTAGEIKEFCTKNYGVTFQMMDKADVRGNTIHPLYQALLDEKSNGYGKIQIKWNFHKILLDEHHQIIKDFQTSVSPLSEEITKLLDAR